jgi:hypothetical protein
MTSSGGFVPSRLEKRALSEEVLVIRRLTGTPLRTAEVTSTSTQVLATTARRLATCAPVAAGLLAQVMPLSLQPLELGKTSPPTGLPSRQKSRSLAETTGSVTGARSKRR